MQPLDHGEVPLHCGGVDGLLAVVVGGGEGHALRVQPLDHGEVPPPCGGVEGLLAVVGGGGEGHALRVQLLHKRQVTGQAGASQRAPPACHSCTEAQLC